MKINEIKDLLAARIVFYLEPHLANLHHYSIENSGNRVKVIGATDDTPSGEYVLIRVFINEGFRKMYICNTSLPDTMRHQGIGRQLIKIVYKVATELGYELFIVPMTEAFRESMKKRGALPCEKPHLLKIANGTMLD
jgi:predicted GNAT family acetyltransferase